MFEFLLITIAKNKFAVITDYRSGYYLFNQNELHSAGFQKIHYGQCVLTVLRYAVKLRTYQLVFLSSALNHSLSLEKHSSKLCFYVPGRLAIGIVYNRFEKQKS